MKINRNGWVMLAPLVWTIAIGVVVIAVNAIHPIHL